jgi:hypothetical protein
MQNLYWKTTGQTRTLIEKPFQTEAEMEKYIFDNQDLLGDVSVTYRQIRTGQKQGIPDMLGVDQDARVCLIELKNQPADEDILPQALGYAIWAETNPDSIKAIWLESKRKPENIEIQPGHPCHSDSAIVQDNGSTYGGEAWLHRRSGADSALLLRRQRIRRRRAR